MSESPAGGTMRRQILGYMPANLVPALLSVATVVVFTRLLSPREFGAYNLGFSAMLFAQGAIFYAIQLAVLRLYPAAEKGGMAAPFMRTLWTGIGLAAGALSLAAAAALLLVPMPRALAGIFWVALGLLLTRAVIGVAQSQNRAENAVGRYVFIECFNAAAGFAAGLALVWYSHRSGFNVMLGLLLAGVLSVLIGARRMAALVWRGGYDAALMRQILTFVLPLTGSYIVTSMLSYADRFLVAALAGAGTLGVYAVAFALVERPTTLLCTLISTATFPMAVKLMEHEGIEAARVQTRKNGAALLALAIPACAGLAFSAHYIAGVLVGAPFRAGVEHLIPPLALAALVRNIGTHYLDHAFHIIRRADLMLAVYGPAALLNVLLDVTLIPRLGSFGAVCASLVSLSLAMLAAIMLGKKYFGLVLPLPEAARITGAVLPMALTLYFFHPPANLWGMMAYIGAGGGAYAAGAVALDVGAVRALIWRRISRSRRFAPAEPR